MAFSSLLTCYVKGTMAEASQAIQLFFSTMA
jgi:hypothetical protein